MRSVSGRGMVVGAADQPIGHLIDRVQLMGIEAEK
jgi:hypothetical protein